MNEIEPTTVEGLYRNGGKLVMREGVEFPDRCAICNKETEGGPIQFTFKREKSHYIEVAAIQTIATAAVDLLQGAKYTGPVEVAIPFCAWHRRRRLRRYCFGAGLMALAAAYLFIRYLIGGAREFDVKHISLETVIAVLVVIGGLGIALETVYDPGKVWFRTKKFYDRFVWVEGAGAEFLSTLPILGGQVENPSPAIADSSSARGKEKQRRSSKTRDTGKKSTGRRREVDESNLSAEELIRRARLAGLDDED
jgi:hypothetical protein